MRTFVEKREDMAACLASEDAVLVLKAEHVEPADVQEVRRAAVRRQIAFGDSKRTRSL
jgi:hypothetical protein